MNARNAYAYYISMAGTLCLFVGWGFSMVGVDKLHQALHSSAKPVDVTCAQLRSYRPGSNVHITLTKFVPYKEGAVVVSQNARLPGSVWLPVIPADEPKGDPQSIVALISFTHIANEADLERKLANHRVTGLIHSRGDPPYAGTIREFNPGINLERCWVVWQGWEPETVAGALPLVIGCPCLFILGMVLAVTAALRPVTAPSDGSLSPLAVQSFVFSFAFAAIGDALRWMQRHGFTLGHLAVLSASGGVLAVSTAGFVLGQDWDHVIALTTEMHLAITGGLFGLGLLASAALLGYWEWTTAAPAPEPALARLTQVEERPSDRRQKGAAVMGFGFVVLVAAGAAFYRGDNSLRPLVLAAIGCPALVGGAVWYGSLHRKGREEKAQFWNEPGA